jgi:hypothetical protein
MEKFKVDLFAGEYKIDFPEYSHLSESECLNLIERLSKIFDMNFMSNVANDLIQKQFFLENINANDEFHLMKVFEKLNINPSLKTYINWYQFRDIDLIKTIDLDKYFYDIWFPSADDIDIFDENLNWIISIRHDGVVSYCKNLLDKI